MKSTLESVICICFVFALLPKIGLFTQLFATFAVKKIWAFFMFLLHRKTSEEENSEISFWDRLRLLVAEKTKSEVFWEFQAEHFALDFPDNCHDFQTKVFCNSPVSVSIKMCDTYCNQTL